LQAPTPTAIQGRGESPANTSKEQAALLIDFWKGAHKEAFLKPQGIDYADAFHHVDIANYHVEYKGDPKDVPLEQRKDVFHAPKNYNEAWDHECPYQREQWREAIRKEFKKMDDHGVWKKVKRSIMPTNRRCVKCRWLFELKRNGVFRARLVACGYSQVPGQDFTEVYSPVVNDTTVRILLITKIIMKLKSKLVDVETAFLHGELKEIIFMDCPPGMDQSVDKCLQLLKTIYGLVQSAKAFYRKLGDVLKAIGFVQRLADQCLFIRKVKA
jgi:hypothetical protein